MFPFIGLKKFIERPSNNCILFKDTLLTLYINNNYVKLRHRYVVVTPQSDTQKKVKTPPQSVEILFVLFYQRKFNDSTKSTAIE